MWNPMDQLLPEDVPPQTPSDAEITREACDLQANRFTGDCGPARLRRGWQREEILQLATHAAEGKKSLVF